MKERSPHSSMTHLNGNLICSIDVETTGADPRKHDIIQIAIVPLNSQLKVLQTVMPFTMYVRPIRPENIEPAATKVHKINIPELMLSALDPWRVADLLVEWFENLKLPVGKRIVPLAHNWIFDRGFIHEWLGPETFDLVFSYHFRDSMTAALFMNDRAEFRTEPIPYPKVSLEYMCSIFKVHNAKAHDALQDAVTTAEVYRRMMLRQPSL